MCFIVTGHFNKQTKKPKKTSKPITAQEYSLIINEVLKNTKFGRYLSMVNEYANPTLFNIKRK